METLAAEFFCLVTPLRSALEKQVIQVQWKFPSPGWFKLNTDGSALGCPGPAGGGGLIRDHHGRWVKGFLRRIGKVCSLEAELWAIRDGLTLCTQLQTQELIIELDAKAVISLVTCNKESFAQYAPLIDDCWNMLQQHPLWKIQHCYREANTCADALAKKAVFSQLDFCILDTPPVELSQLLIQDQSGLFCNRICNYTAPVAVV